MPVIGRLDGQVNDVMIEPVGKARRGRDDAGAPLEGGLGSAEETPRGDSSPASRDHDDSSSTSRDEDARARERDDERDEGGRTRGDERLPVWLL